MTTTLSDARRYTDLLIRCGGSAREIGDAVAHEWRIWWDAARRYTDLLIRCGGSAREISDAVAHEWGIWWDAHTHAWADWGP